MRFLSCLQIFVSHPGLTTAKKRALPPARGCEMFCPVMSEFKFACPTCGQHIKCDSSQSGMAMDCPTCFQKICIPQAPTGSQRLLLTGTKVKKIASDNAPAPAVIPLPRSSGPWVVILILLFVGVVAAAIYWATIIRPRHATHGPIRQAPAPSEFVAPSAPVEPAPTAPDVPVAPTASDASWRLDLAGSTLPETPVAGRIHGQDFRLDRAVFQNGALSLRAGSHTALEFGAVINFSGVPAEALAGKNINITTNTDRAARVTLRWKDGTVQKADYTGGYALRLEFGQLDHNRLPGKIYLGLPDDAKSYLLGAFSANVSKPKPPK
jgi:DNA-directed RNA polymerase subunit RPC12/RpoP